MKTNFLSRERPWEKLDHLVVGQVRLVDCGTYRCAAYLDGEKTWRNCYTGERVRVVRVLGGVGGS